MAAWLWVATGVCAVMHVVMCAAVIGYNRRRGRAAARGLDIEAMRAKVATHDAWGDTFWPLDRETLVRLIDAAEEVQLEQHACDAACDAAAWTVRAIHRARGSEFQAVHPTESVPAIERAARSMGWGTEALWADGLGTIVRLYPRGKA